MQMSSALAKRRMEERRIKQMDKDMMKEVKGMGRKKETRGGWGGGRWVR